MQTTVSFWAVWFGNHSDNFEDADATFGGQVLALNRGGADRNELFALVCYFGDLEIKSFDAENGFLRIKHNCIYHGPRLLINNFENASFDMGLEGDV